MKPRVCRKRRHNAGLAATLLVLPLLMFGCAHATTDHIAELHPDLIAADKKCTSQAWPNEVAAVNCLDAVEAPIVQRDAPAVLQPFETFSARRKLLARRFDDENTVGGQFSQGTAEAMAILVAHEPRLADKDSLLSKEIHSVSPKLACASHRIMIDRVNCEFSIGRPIWERDAPETIEYYEQYQKRRLQLAKEFDAAGGQKILASASDHFASGMKEAVDEFKGDAQRAIQQQRAAEAQSAAEQARRNAETLIVIGELAGAFSEGAKAVACAKGNVAAC